MAKESIQAILERHAVYCYTDSLTEYTSRNHAGIISKYEIYVVLEPIPRPVFDRTDKCAGSLAFCGSINSHTS